MKKLLFAFFLLSSFCARAQFVEIMRSPLGVQVDDNTLRVIQNFTMPVYDDTTSANSNFGNDYIASIFMIPATGVIYYRDTTAAHHRWNHLPIMITATASLNFPSTTSTTVSDLTITVTGAVIGDALSLGIANASITSTASFTAWVSAANTITVRFSPKATEDPAAGTFKITIIRY